MTETLGRVAIVGAGQVGTMLGMALSNSGAVTEVGLADLNPARLEASLARGAGRRALETDPEVLEAQVILLALPVPGIVAWLERNGPEVHPATLVVDTGSAKRLVVEAMRDHVASGAHAVGGHPMTGTEVPGPDGARPELLKGAPFVLCPVRDDPPAMRAAHRLVEALGAEAVDMDGAVHDRVVARTSHLPHLLAAALAVVAGDQEVAVAGPGLSGATRLAASDPALTASFLTANADQVHAAAGELIEVLEGLTAAAAGGPKALADLLTTARAARERLIP
ncbi:MAG TPA: prephenate dehydrogenase [Actinomycetota bacterium]|jgi:prephenate dehydrogenase